MGPRYSRYYTYIKPILGNKTVKTYSSLVFSLITITIFSLYAIKPTIMTILSLQKSITQQNEILDKIQKKVNDLTEGKKNYNNIPSSTKEKLKFLIPYDPALPSLMESLTLAAQAQDASISGIQFQPTDLENPKLQPTKTASLKEVEFTMNIQGDYQKLLNLLEQFNKMDRLISISTISFTKPQDAPIVMAISGKAFFIKN